MAACSMRSHAHTRIQLSAMQHQSSSQRVGAVLIHRLVWVDQHTGGSRLTPTRKGWLWVAHVIRQHSSTVQKHPKHGSGTMTIQGKNCKKIHENHDDQCSVKCPIPGDGYRRRSGTRRPLTIVVRVRCLARRRKPTQPIDVEKRVGESDDKSVMNRQRQRTLPRYDHHLCSDSCCWKSYREIVTQRSFDGAEHE